MSLYDLSTSYIFNPFGTGMPLDSTYQTRPFYTPMQDGYYSIFSQFPKSPVLDVFDCSTFGFTPTTSTCYFGQSGINPPYNVFPYPINTIATNYNLPIFMPNYNFGSLTGNFNRGNDIYSNPFARFGSVLTNGNDWTNNVFQSNSSNKYSSKVPTIQKALDLALKEYKAGVREIGNSNDSPEIRKYKNGAKNDLPWCGSFVSWIYGAGQNSNNSKTFGYSMQSQAIRRRAQKAGHYATKDSGYTPKPGDLMILKYNDTSGHVGVVTEVFADGSFETIEGNKSNAVRKVNRSMSTANLHGFVKMDEWLKAA